MEESVSGGLPGTSQQNQFFVALRPTKVDYIQK